VKGAARLTYSVLAASLAFAPALGAEEPAPSPVTISPVARASAEALFQEGVRLSKRNQLEEACKKFAASDALDVAVGTLLRLADCRERTGRFASAWARFREARSLAELQGMTERARIAAVRSAALEHKLARLVLLVPPAPPRGYTVKLGELTVPPDSWGTALPLDAGTVSVEASAPGYVTYRRYVAIPPEEGARVQVPLPPLEPQRAPASPRPAANSDSPAKPSEERTSLPRSVSRGYAARVVGASLAATGGVGLATGGVLALVAKKRHDASLERCSGVPRRCSARGEELQDESERFATYAAVSAAIGGGLLVAGLVVYLTAPSERGRKPLAFGVAPDARGGWSLQAAGAF
jgi:hypothetical protein